MNNPKLSETAVAGSHYLSNRGHCPRITTQALKSAWRAVFWIAALALCLSMCSCSSTKVVTQTVERVSKDTVYLSNTQYDSIYIYQDHVSEHHIGTLKPLETPETFGAPMRTDTLYIKDVSIEYRYRLLKDTVRLVERDSIPYEVTIVETKEIIRPLTFFDHLCRYSFFFLLGIFLYLIYRKLKPLKLF